MSESKTASLRDTFLLINFAVESALRSGLKIQLLLKIKYHMGVREKKCHILFEWSLRQDKIFRIST